MVVYIIKTAQNKASIVNLSVGLLLKKKRREEDEERRKREGGGLTRFCRSLRQNRKSGSGIQRQQRHSIMFQVISLKVSPK